MNALASIIGLIVKTKSLEVSQLEKKHVILHVINFVPAFIQYISSCDVPVDIPFIHYVHSYCMCKLCFTIVQ